MRYLFAVLILLLLLALPARAQDVQRITFDEAVQIALEQNVNLKRAANNRRFDEINLSRRRADFFPDVTFSANGSQNYGRNFSQETLNFVNQTTNRMSASVRSSVTLFDGFNRQSAYREAQRAFEAGNFDFERQRQTVVFTVISNYLTLLERSEQIRIQQENLESQQQQLAQIEEFTNVGSRPISDLYQQQAQAANAELNLLNAERAFQISEVNLIQILQLDPFGQYEFVAPTIDDTQLTSEMYDIPTMLTEAYGQRFDLKARENDIVAAREGIRAARSSYFPNISLSVGTSSSFDDQSQFSFVDQFTDNRRASFLGLNLSVPIFDRFLTRNNIQQSRVQYNNATLNLEELQQNIALDVRQSYLDYLTAEKSLEVTEKQEIAAQQALTAAEERYNVGAATLVELTQARADFVQAASDRLQSKYDFLFQKKLIDYYMGKLDPTEPLFDQ